MIYNKSTYYKRSFKYSEGGILMLINIIKINLLAAVFILAALLISRLLKNKYSVRWKYFVWLFVAVFLLFPFDLISTDPVIQVRIPQNIYLRHPAEASSDAAHAEADKKPASEKDRKGLPSEESKQSTAGNWN